jgi:hypothetical protein
VGVALVKPSLSAVVIAVSISAITALIYLLPFFPSANLDIVALWQNVDKRDTQKSAMNTVLNLDIV